MTKELMFTGLLDLAQADTSDVKAQVRQLTPEGVYIVLWESAELVSGEKQNSEPWVQCLFKGITKEFMSLSDDPVEAENIRARVVERGFSMGAFMDVSNLAESVALLKGRFYAKAGLPTDGQIGGFGGVVGWIDGAIGKIVAVQVTHRTGKDGEVRDRFMWLDPKKLEEFGIDEAAWEEVKQNFETDMSNYDSAPTEQTDDGLSTE